MFSKKTNLQANNAVFITGANIQHPSEAKPRHVEQSGYTTWTHMTRVMPCRNQQLYQQVSVGDVVFGAKWANSDRKITHVNVWHVARRVGTNQS
jgi:hypothetical protein